MQVPGLSQINNAVVRKFTALLDKEDPTPLDYVARGVVGTIASTALPVLCAATGAALAAAIPAQDIRYRHEVKATTGPEKLMRLGEDALVVGLGLGLAVITVPVGAAVGVSFMPYVILGTLQGRDE